MCQHWLHLGHSPPVVSHLAWMELTIKVQPWKTQAFPQPAQRERQRAAAVRLPALHAAVTVTSFSAFKDGPSGQTYTIMLQDTNQPWVDTNQPWGASTLGLF